MKKITSILLLIALVAVLLCGCANKGRLNYNYNMEKYVQLDSYKVEVDSNSELYENYFNGKIRSIMKTTKTEGVVANGDVANINYVGKKDGVAFEGGTANGYDLTIGSGSFIDGFEAGLVGVKIGTTVDLNLTFPKDYKNTDLAGQDVVFTVTVNHVTVTYDTVDEENAKACGYNSAQDVTDIAKDYAFKQTALDLIYQKTQIKSNPEKEIEIFYNDQINVYKSAAKKNSMSYEEYAAYYDMTVSQLENYTKENYAIPLAKEYALCYYIIDAADQKITDDLLDKKKQQLVEETGRNIAEIGVSENYIEAEVARELAEKIVIENAVLK